MRVVRDNILHNNIPHSESEAWSYVDACRFAEPWNVSCFCGLFALVFCHVHGHARSSGVYGLARRFEDESGYHVVWHWSSDRLAFLSCTYYTFHARRIHARLAHQG